MEGPSSNHQGSSQVLQLQPMDISSEISSTDGNNAPSTSSQGSATSSSNVGGNNAALASTAETSLNLTLHQTTAPSSGGGVDELEPLKKKARVDGSSGTNTLGVKKGPEKLESRLGGILCCAVCIDLPSRQIYQCQNGHLICSGCFTHLLADARLRDEIATCPNCRVEISKHMASRNLAVEKAISELGTECQYCSKEFPRNLLEYHERELCEERISICKFSRIGCPWRGPFHELLHHQENCIHPKKSGADVMDILTVFDQDLEKDKKLYASIFELLNYEKITFNDLQLKPYRTDEFVHKLYYETSRFSAFNNQWVVKARINNNQRDPTQSVQRQLTYQLILKTKPTSNLDMSFVVLKGPFGDLKVSPSINRFDFNESQTESPYFHLPIVDTAEVNRLLSQKAVHFRLIAFLQ